MNTEHIFQIGISVDEDTIRGKAEEAAVRQLVELVEKTYVDSYRSTYSKKVLSSRYDDALKEAIVEHIITPYKEQIIADVVKEVSGKILRSKAMKEADV